MLIYLSISLSLVLPTALVKDDDKVDLVWSYGVRFEPSPVAWASRWDSYLQMNDAEVSLNQSFP